MRCLYEELLEPNLYHEKPRVAQFIDSLAEPEIDTSSDDCADNFIEDMVPTDDIADCMHFIQTESELDINEYGSVSPSFFAFYNKKLKPLRLLSENPDTQSRVDNLLSAGKCMAFVTTASVIFFRSLVYHEDEKICIDKTSTKAPRRGIHIIGSSVRGNCFVSLVDVDSSKRKSRFTPVLQKITRESKCDYPFSDFFNIRDEEEMCNIIQQAEKIMYKVNLSEEDCLINFATTLKVLLFYGHKS